MKFAANFIIAIALVVSFDATAQNIQQLSNLGDSAYLQKNYPLAIEYYNKAAAASYPAFTKSGVYYNIACCYGLQKDNSNAWKYLDSAVYYGYTDYAHMTKDGDLTTLHTDKKKWKRIEKLAKKASDNLKDPAKAQLVTSDIHNFWMAYDAVKQDSTKEVMLYKSMYFDKASVGLKDYFQSRIYTAEAFVANQKRKRQFYAAIRANTLMVDAFKGQMKSSFIQLKNCIQKRFFQMYILLLADGTAPVRFHPTDY